MFKCSHHDLHARTDRISLPRPALLLFWRKNKDEEGGEIGSEEKYYSHPLPALLLG